MEDAENVRKRTGVGRMKTKNRKKKKILKSKKKWKIEKGN